MAGHAPSADVVWFVGLAGAIVVSIQPVKFERLPFPERVDLVSVTAVDERRATVTAADGRRFETRDRGTTWVIRPQ